MIVKGCKVLKNNELQSLERTLAVV